MPDDSTRWSCGHLTWEHGREDAVTCGGASAPPVVRDNISTLLRDRFRTHGSFADHARATCDLKSIVADECRRRAERGQAALTYCQREALDMICHKIGRIIAGDPTHADHWDDIAGYARLANGPPP